MYCTFIIDSLNYKNKIFIILDYDSFSDESESDKDRRPAYKSSAKKQRENRSSGDSTPVGSDNIDSQGSLRSPSSLRSPQQNQGNQQENNLGNQQQNPGNPQQNIGNQEQIPANQQQIPVNQQQVDENAENIENQGNQPPLLHTLENENGTMVIFYFKKRSNQ